MITTTRRHLAGAADEPSRNGRPRAPSGPVLRFTPWAWAKLLFLRDAGPTEVGGFGITRQADLFLVQDVVLVRQQTTATSVRFEDVAVADFFDRQVDRGRRPEEFARIWVHTHPGEWPEPSGTDEETFERVFGRADWAVMFILARGGADYARLRFGCGPGAELRVSTDVDWSVPFPAADHEAWQAEYAECVAAPEVFETPGLRPCPDWPQHPFEQECEDEFPEDQFLSELPAERSLYEF